MNSRAHDTPLLLKAAPICYPIYLDTTTLLARFEPLFEQACRAVCDAHPDPSHDILHVARVVALTRRLAAAEGGDLAIMIPAAYLHDIEFVSKADPRRSQASRLSAQKAIRLLTEWGYPQEHHSAISHAIAAHSFSANLRANTLEAKIVQDADRLDGLGAIGVARCFSSGGTLGRRFYEPREPFPNARQPDDQDNTLDHFYIKLLKVADRLHTETARAIGMQKTAFLRAFLDQLQSDLL